MGKGILNISNTEQHLSIICSSLLVAIAKQQQPTMSNALLSALWDMHRMCHQDIIESSHNILSFGLKEQDINNAVRLLEGELLDQCPTAKPLKQSISYLLDELTCNMQQHSQASFGLAYLAYNKSTNTIDIALADAGITIYGSYVKAEKYLNLIGESDAEALCLAQEGYSTKDLPEAENRGYGLSSNINMVTNGLKGEFAIVSGCAMSIFTANDSKLFALPEETEWNGTLVVTRIPIDMPQSYNFYNYIS